MATGTSVDAQIGVKLETTHGVPVAVNRFYPFNSEGVTADRQEVVSQGIMATRVTMDSEARKVGVQKVGGPVDLDLYRENFAQWFQFALGSISSTSNGGSAPYTHTCRLASSRPSFTYQKGVSFTSNGGGVAAYTFGGCKVKTWSLSGSVGQPVKFKAELTGGVVETTGTALASASYANNADVPFVFTEGTVTTVNGVAVRVESFEFNGDNKLAEDRVYAGDQITREQLVMDRFVGSGKLTCEFYDTTQWALYRDSTYFTTVLTFSDGTNSVTLNYKTYFTGPSTPTVAGPGIQKHDLSFSNVYGDGSDGDALSVVVVNSGSLTP